MKKFFTLCVLTCFVMIARPQAVLNEFYPQPGNGYQEFFELYNENNSIEYLDNYTLVVYYEEAGGKSGFYVLDLPNDSMAAHGYYVGASKLTFDIQLQPGLTADFDWNNMPAGGSLTKWEKSGSSYVSVPVPANLNDLFVRIGGAGGVYHVFLFKNGILVNGVIGGINTSTLPAYIKAMPDLFVDMSGSSPDFTIKFNAIPDNSIEYIPNSVGTNNGYYRSADGLCGEWLKSDQPGQHNPGSTNGTSSSSSSQLSISAVISLYVSDPSKSLLIYNITAAPADAFPVIVSVYLDSGIRGEWDIMDSLIDTRTILSASAGSQNIILPRNNVDVILVVQPASKCYSKTLAIGNYASSLPVQLITYSGSMNNNNRVALQWTVAGNETADRFEIQRSIAGSEYTTVGLVLASERTGTEDYTFYETINTDEKIIYRLKLIDRQQNSGFSKSLVFQAKTSNTSPIKIFGNPVKDKLTFSFTSANDQTVDMKVYDISGRIQVSQKINSAEGSNVVSLSLSQSLKPGLYVVEINEGSTSRKAKFIKQ